MDIPGLLGRLAGLPGAINQGLLGSMPVDPRLGLDPQMLQQARQGAGTDFAMGLVAGGNDPRTLLASRRGATEGFRGRVFDLLKEQETSKMMAARDEQQKQAAMIDAALRGSPVPEGLSLTQAQWDAVPAKEKMTLMGQYVPKGPQDLIKLDQGDRLYDPASRQEVYSVPAAPPAPPKPPDAPSGYQWTANGQLAPIPGGPADMSGPGANKFVQPIRKEYEGLDAVKNYKVSLPMLRSAKQAPDTGYGDLDLIYAVGKTLDPASVVREGELALTIAAGSPVQRILGVTRFTTEKGGRLTPTQRTQLVSMLENRMASLKQQHDYERDRFKGYAPPGIDPETIVGKPPEEQLGIPAPTVGGEWKVMPNGTKVRVKP